MKRQIAIRTLADWDDVRPGFFEIDLGAHCGDWSGGSFLHTLVLTDVATGWIEFCPLLRRGEVDVTEGLGQARRRLPMPVLGLDTDNGSEFINYEMLGYCEREGISFTRTRAYKKNDQCHIEEKNSSVVRRMIGYSRYEGSGPLGEMAEIYEILRLYVNFFRPSVKLSSKRRDGSHVVKTYEVAKTPYQRLIESKAMSPAGEGDIEVVYEALDPVALLSQLAQLQQQLWMQAYPVTRNTVVTVGDMARPLVASSAPPKAGCAASPKHRTNASSGCTGIAVTAAEDAGAPSTTLEAASRPKRPYRKRRPTPVPHTWRTREDPFADVDDRPRIQLLLSPKRTAKGLLDRVQQETPGGYSAGRLRTLRRRVRRWRREALPCTPRT